MCIIDNHMMANNEMQNSMIIDIFCMLGMNKNGRNPNSDSIKIAVKINIY